MSNLQIILAGATIGLTMVVCTLALMATLAKRRKCSHEEDAPQTWREQEIVRGHGFSLGLPDSLIHYFMFIPAGSIFYFDSEVFAHEARLPATPRGALTPRHYTPANLLFGSAMTPVTLSTAWTEPNDGVSGQLALFVIGPSTVNWGGRRTWIESAYWEVKR